MSLPFTWLYPSLDQPVLWAAEGSQLPAPTQELKFPCRALQRPTMGCWEAAAHLGSRSELTLSPRAAVLLGIHCLPECLVFALPHLGQTFMAGWGLGLVLNSCTLCIV